MNNNRTLKVNMLTCHGNGSSTAATQVTHGRSSTVIVRLECERCTYVGDGILAVIVVSSEGLGNLEQSKRRMTLLTIVRSCSHSEQLYTITIKGNYIVCRKRKG